jgi:DNA-binding MarR family transcriptional regulator
MSRAELDECRQCLCFAVRRAARLITQRYDAHLRPVGLRGTQFTMLAVLTGTGAQPLNRLADVLGMERTTLTRNLRPLLARGYVEVEPGEDRRVRTIAVTRQGREATVRALPYWRKAQRELERRLGGEAVKSLGELGRLAA